MDDERMERLIASNENLANAIVRLVQVMERKATKPERASRVRRVPPVPSVEVEPGVHLVVNRSLKRILGR